MRWLEERMRSSGGSFDVVTLLSHRPTWRYFAPRPGSTVDQREPSCFNVRSHDRFGDSCILIQHSGSRGQPARRCTVFVTHAAPFLSVPVTATFTPQRVSCLHRRIVSRRRHASRRRRVFSPTRSCARTLAWLQPLTASVTPCSPSETL
jgi:hypothetical protein